MNLTQLTSINSYTLPVFPKTQIQFKEGGVLNLPFNQPFYNKSLFGYYGCIFMRGYEYYVIDGDAGIMGRATLQHEIFNITTNVHTGTKKQVSYPFQFFRKIIWRCSDMLIAKNPATVCLIINYCIVGV